MKQKLWIAKPEPGAGRFKKALMQEGAKQAQLLIEPVMEINAPKTLPHFSAELLGAVDALLITSPHALRYVAQAESLAALPAYVVGERAKAALKVGGHQGEVIAFENIEALLTRVEDAYAPPTAFASADVTPPQGSGNRARMKLLYLSGEHVTREVEEPLDAMGIACERVITYRQSAAQQLSPELIEAIRNHTITHVTLTSPRVALLCSTLAQRYGGQVGEIVALCQSEQIAKVAEGVGFELCHVADAPTSEAMVKLVVEHLK